MTTENLKELQIERTFEAPRELVFRAWLEPEHLSRWYGPEHFSVPEDRISIDPRVGGRWELVMLQGDSGNEFPVGATIAELVEPELLVLENDALPEHGMGVTHTRVEFHDEGGKTRMVMTDGPYAEQMGEMAGMGWAGAFAKLEGVVAG